MKNITAIIAIILLASCQSINNPSFEQRRGKYTYYDHSWGGRCPWMPALPMKRTAYNNQAYGGYKE